MKKLWSLLVIGSFWMFACDGSSPTAPMPDPDSGASGVLGSWALQSLEPGGGDPVPVNEPERYTIQFTEEGRAHIRADCNVCNADFESDSTSLSIGLMACTLAACPPDSLEADYVRALGSASAYERSDSELVIRYDGGVLRFAPI